MDLNDSKVVEKNYFFFEYGSPRINLDGLWQLPVGVNGDRPMVQIIGNRIIWENNSMLRLTFLSQMESIITFDHSTEELSFQLGDQLYRGKLIDSNHILWNRNETWSRIHVPTSTAYSTPYPSPLFHNPYQMNV